MLLQVSGAVAATLTTLLHLNSLKVTPKITAQTSMTMSCMTFQTRKQWTRPSLTF